MRTVASLALAAALLAVGPTEAAPTARAANPPASRGTSASAPPPAGAAARSARPASASPAKKPATAASKAAPKKAVPAAPAQQRRQLQAEQQQLQTKLAQARRRLDATEASHAEASDALRSSEAAISAAGRHLRELAADRRQVERQIAALQERSRQAEARQGAARRQLGRVLATGVALDAQPPWQPLLAGRAPQQDERDLAYLGYAARDGAQAVDQLQDRRAELALLETQSRERQAELAQIAAAEEESRRQLLRQQAARRQTLDRLARQLGSQRQSVTTLARDEKRLSALIDELSRILAQQAEQAKRERERQAAAKKGSGGARAAAPPRGGGGSPALPPADVTPPAGSRFAQLRGKLTLPVQGEVTARFGTARRTDAGVDAPTWKGVFIRAAEGAEVRAVAAGRVVFADWLRGFGNLLIVDHGEGFLSVYGNNQSLFASTGERVDAGAVIASVGSSGGNRDAGLYFELRYQGQAFDPLRWVATR